MTELKMFKGDLQPSVKATIKSGDTPLDLTGCTAKLQLVEVDTGVTIFSKDADILTPETNGVVQYDWQTGDTLQSKKKYKIRIEITFADLTTQTFPKDDDFYLILQEKEGV